MITSAQSLRAWSIGRLSAMAPSTSSRPSISTGDIAPGTDMLARIAWDRLPWSSTTCWPVSMSVAIALNGIGSFRKSVTPKAGVAIARKNDSIATPASTPLGSASSPSLTPELGREQRLVVVDLAPDRDFPARRLVPEDLFPVGLEDDLLHLRRRPARGERRPHDRAHAGARHARDRHAQFVKHLEHAHVRNAACSAARQREPDAGTDRGRPGWAVCACTGGQ